MATTPATWIIEGPNSRPAASTSAGSASGTSARQTSAHLVLGPAPGEPLPA
jgi:hypothetical protein